MKVFLRRNWLELTFGGAVLVFLLIFVILKMHGHDEPQQNTDVNRDGLTNEMDYKLLMDKFGTACSICNEDINCDGLIDGKDMLILLGEYNKGQEG